MSSTTPSTVEVDELAHSNGIRFQLEEPALDEIKNNKSDFFKITFNYVKISLLQLTVEPIIFLVYLGWIFGNTIQSPGMYRKFVGYGAK